MGVSTDAILAFGFNLGEGDLADIFGVTEMDEDDDFDFYDWIAGQAGAIYPEGHSGIDSPEYQEYHAKYQAAIEACPVEVIMHCSYDYPMYFLAAKKTKQRARRGYPESINIDTPSPDRIAAMKDFCERYSIPWQEPQWHIFSMWS